MYGTKQTQIELITSGCCVSTYLPNFLMSVFWFWVCKRWFKYDRDWFVCKQAALRRSRRHYSPYCCWSLWWISADGTFSPTRNLITMRFSTLRGTFCSLITLGTARQDWTGSNPSRREGADCGFTLSRSHSCCAVRLVYIQISPGHIWTTLYINPYMLVPKHVGDDMCHKLRITKCIFRWYTDYKNKQVMNNIKHWNYGSLASLISRIKSKVVGGSIQKNTGKTAFCAVTNDLARTVLNYSTFSFFLWRLSYKCLKCKFGSWNFVTWI